MTDAKTSAPTDEPKKRPASQYYWGDWWIDKGLHSCSLTARGLWHEMNCLMHEGEPYGHLTLNEKPMTPTQLANQCRISKAQCVKLLAELEAAGVPSRTPAGVLYSRRMVRDEASRIARAEGGKEGGKHGIKGAEHGAKGGRPRKVEGGSDIPPHDDSEGGLETPMEPPPSAGASSSSSSSSKEEREKRAPTPAGQACLAMRQAGLTSVNPGDPRLTALLAAGMTADELAAAAGDAVASGKGFAYAMATAEGRRLDAAKVKTLPRRINGADDPFRGAV